MLSIVTPVLNGIKFIQNNIESIQKLSIDYEHIIVDGGSTDGTVELVSKYPHIKLLHQNNKTGMYGAIHQGFLNSKGKYITWLNADDYLIKNGYELMYNYIISKDLDFVYSNGIYHYKEDNKYKKFYGRHFGRHLLKKAIVPFIQPCTIYSRVTYDKVGGVDFKRFKIIGDRDLFQRMAYNPDIKFGYISVFSVVFLIHSNSLLATSQELKLKEYSYCINSDVNLVSRVLFKLSGFIRKLESLF